MKESTRVLVALGAALGAGAAVAASGDARLLRAAEAIAPVGILWINAIRRTVIPLAVSLLVTGVAGAADLRPIGRIGGGGPPALVAPPATTPPPHTPPPPPRFSPLAPRGPGLAPSPPAPRG